MCSILHLWLLFEMRDRRDGQKHDVGNFADSLRYICKDIPSFAPKASAWGKFTASSPDSCFLRTEYLDLALRMVDPVVLCSRIANLHQMSTSSECCLGLPNYEVS